MHNINLKIHKFFNIQKLEFKKYIKYKYFVLMFIPVIMYYIIFKYIPMAGIALAFKTYKIKLGIWGSSWVGLYHFNELFTTPSFWEVFSNTIIISLLKLIVIFPAPICFAILLNEVKNTIFKKTIQTISYLPHFLSWVVLGGIFTQFLSPSTGPINIMLKQFTNSTVYFLGDPAWFRGVLVGTALWHGLGWASIVYFAALTGIDPTLYEAAIIDGANRFQKIIYITLPSLVPVITIMFIMQVGKIMTDDFDQIFNLYSPAVYKVGDVIGTYVYRKGIVDLSYEFATAVGLFQNIIAFSLIILSNTIIKKFSEYTIW